jgi:cyclopropane-fatty-acyl-phospholipid synthase
VAADLLRLGIVGPQPKPPLEEMAMSGSRHSKRRDRQAISHHYDVGNDFYADVLGPSMVYSCAYWTSTDPAYGLADAQRDKLDLICRKLELKPGMRLLDVGCGWGSLALHAAREYSVRVLGITLSTEQADYARKQVAEAGLTEQVEIRIQDYREVDEAPFDAISSVGMAEHVGTGPYAEYAGILYRQLRPGGRLLNHQIAAIHPEPKPSYRTFIDAYVFPDGELAPLGTTVSLIEEAGFEVRDVQTLREHYGRTLRAWVANLEAEWSDAVRLTSPGRARVWRLYMAASALAFEAGRIGVNQVLAVRPHRDGTSDMPPTRAGWLA